MTTRRKEVKVRNNPGIYKEYRWSKANQKWIPTERFRAIRRTMVSHPEGERSIKVQAFFDSLEDAKAFRAGALEKGEGRVTNRQTKFGKGKRTFFKDLVKEWKEIHFETLEAGTKQKYTKLLPSLRFLDDVEVDLIDPRMVDRLIKFWKSPQYPKGSKRETFTAELKLLRTILTFYRTRFNYVYVVPVLRFHFDAGDIVKKPRNEVKALEPEQLRDFLSELRKAQTKEYYFLALAQLGMGLRIGEACALTWSHLNFKKRIARIEKVVIWDQFTWKPSIKNRPKGKWARELVIPAFLAEELEILRMNRDSEVDLLFHRNGKPLNRKTICSAYNRALKNAGLKGVSGTHLMRKTSGTMVNDLTGDIYSVQKALGHRSTKTTEVHYVREGMVQKQKYANAIDSAFGSSLAVVDETDEVLETENRPVPQRPARRTARRNLRIISSS